MELYHAKDNFMCSYYFSATMVLIERDIEEKYKEIILGTAAHVLAAAFGVPLCWVSRITEERTRGLDRVVWKREGETRTGS